MKFLNGRRTGQVCFKDCLTVNLDICCFNLTTPFQTRKEEEEYGELEAFQKSQKIKTIDLTLNNCSFTRHHQWRFSKGFS